MPQFVFTVYFETSVCCGVFGCFIILMKNLLEMVNKNSKNIPKILENSPSIMDSQQLPLCSDVLLDYLYEKNEHPSSSATFAMMKDRTLARLISVYDMVPQPIISAARIEEKLKQLLKEYALVKKNSPTSLKPEKFKLSLANLFDISKCKCPMEP